MRVELARDGNGTDLILLKNERKYCCMVLADFERDAENCWDMMNKSLEEAMLLN